jgi:hypothetical protein
VSTSTGGMDLGPRFDWIGAVQFVGALFFL